MSTELEVKQFNDELYSTYIGEPHDIASHRKKHSVNKPSILLNLLALILIAALGGMLVESGIFEKPSKAEALDIPLIPNIHNIITLPTDQPPTVDSPRETDERATRSIQRKLAITTPRASVASGPSKVERMISFALAQRGARYRFGATGPNAFDCSGLVVAAFRAVGISLPHYTGSLMGRGIKVSRGNLRRGDLIFPTSSHVGIYLGGNKMVVASSGHGRVMIQTVYSFYTGRRIL